MSDADDIADNVKAQKLRADAVARAAESAAVELQDVADAVKRAEQLLMARGVKPSRTDGLRGVHAQADLAELGTWEELTAANGSWLDDAGLSDMALEDVLSAQELNELESFDALGRERWQVSDFVTVGGCAVIGVLATAFDDQIDAAVKAGLAGVGRTDTVKGWEKAGKRLPIDHGGLGVGGPGHRVRSSGHDVGRPFAALRQIMDGEFRGTTWVNKAQIPVVFPGYEPHDLPEALILWLKHLGADFVTTTSLPLPWWSKLYEMDSRDCRKLAHNLYRPGGVGPAGLNVRSMFLSKALPLITTELIVGVKVHCDARTASGSFALNANQELRRDEMLLAGHVATGLASVGKSAVVGYSKKNPLALRHLNAPVLARAGWLAVKVTHEHRRRRDARRVPTWDEIIAEQTLPWELDELQQQRNL